MVTPQRPAIGAEALTPVNGDLNNTSAARQAVQLESDPAYYDRSLAIPAEEDDPTVRELYRPFLQDEDVTKSDWISRLELSTVMKMSEADIARNGGDRLKILILYGSMRSR